METRSTRILLSRATQAGLLIALPLLFLTQTAVAQPYTIVINLKSGETVKGTLLEFTTTELQIDPDGSVSFLQLKTDDMFSVQIVDLDIELFFPLSEDEIPNELRSYKEESLEKPIEPTTHRWLRRLSLTGSIGQMYAEESGGDGLSSQIDLRYYFRTNDVRARKMFVALSYYSSSLSSQHVRHIGVTGGFTTKQTEIGSYFYMDFGIVFHGNTIRFDGGYVHKIAHRVGAEISAGMDFDIEGKKTTLSGNVWDVREAYYNVAFGLVYDL